MAEFPMPQPDEKQVVYPPYTGITFTYCTEENGKLVQQTETMIEQGLAKRYPSRLLSLFFPIEEANKPKVPKGAFLVYTPKQMRFLVKSFLALFVAQAELAEKLKAGETPNPPNFGGGRGGDITSV